MESHISLFFILQDLSKQMGIPLASIQSMVATMSEANPMMGCRGVRVSITKPEIAEMQVRAILSGAFEAKKEGIDSDLEIMIPLVGTLAETEYVKSIIDKTAAGVWEACGTVVPYKVGTMIETPRACVDAGNIAKIAAFFSFGTNDLTAMTFGYSRDDAPKWIPKYVDCKILPDDPFQTLDVEGVGELIKMAITKGRATNPDIVIGVCGEVGGDERSVPFFVKAGVNYVSCSPYRVPIALLAAAQAALNK
jgi:pyruvate,orthophosphate dikinase